MIKGSGGRGGGGRGADGASQFVRGTYKSFKEINLTVLKKMHQFIIGWEAGAGRVEQLNLCVETIHYFKGI